MNITSNDYYTEIDALATNLIQEAIDQTDSKEEAVEALYEHLIHETIDGHQFIIYNAYNLDIIQYSNNSDYMEDNIGGIAETFESGGLSGLHAAIAFYAMYQDVSDEIQEQLKEI